MNLHEHKFYHVVNDAIQKMTVGMSGQVDASLMSDIKRLAELGILKIETNQPEFKIEDNGFRVTGKIETRMVHAAEETITELKKRIEELEEWKRCQNLKTKDRAGEWNALVNKDALNEITNKENIKKFVEFLKAEGVVVEEEHKPQDFEHLYGVWTGKITDSPLDQ